MSGSTRSVVLKLSVTEAESVRTELEKLGAAGDATLKRLETAAERAKKSTSDFTPVLQRAGAEADRAAGFFGRAGQAAGSFGFQMQDAAVQIGMGTNALTVMAQQGSQFLGVFGTGGAIAGATLAIGVLVYQLLEGKDATEQFNEAAKQSKGLYENLETAADRYTASIERQRKKLIELQTQIAAVDATERDYQLRQARRVETGLQGSLSAIRREAESATSFLPDAAGMERLRQLNEATNRVRSQTGQAPLEIDPGLLTLQRAREEFRASSPDDIEAYGRFAKALDDVAKSGGEAGKRAKEFLDTLDKGYPNARKAIDELTANKDLQALLRGETPLALGSAPEAPGEDTSGQERRAVRTAETAAKRAAAVIEKNAETLQLSWDNFWDGADKRSEERAVKEGEDRLKAARQEQDKRAREAEAILRRQQAQAERSTDEVVRYGADMFADMFSTTEGGWDRMWQNMQRTAVAIIARIAAEAVIRPVITPIVQGMFTAAGSGGASTNVNGTITGGGFGGLTNLLNFGSGGSLSSGIDAWGAANLGFLGFGPQANVAPASTLGLNSVEALEAALPKTPAPPPGILNGGSATGGFNSLSNVFGVLGGIVPGLLNGNYKQAAAGGAGALAGTFLLPGVGTVLGGALGNLVGGMFGDDPARPASSVQIAIDENGQLVVAGSRSKGMSSAEGVAQAQSSLASLNAAVSSRGLSLAPSNGAVAQTHQGSDARPGADQEEITRVVLSSITGGSEAVMQVIAREIAKGAAASLDQAFSDIDWIKTVYEPLTTTTPAVSAFQASLDAVNKTFDDAEVKAESLGLATAELAARQVQAIDDLIAARDRAYSTTSQGLFARQRSAMGDQLGADLLTFDANAQAQREALAEELRQQGAEGEAFSGQMRLLEDTLWWERKNIAERGAAEVLAAERSAAGSAANVIRSLADYSRSLAVGADSPLSAQDQFAAAQRQFNAVSSAALAGDANSLSSLQNYAQTYLTASRSLYGSTEGYAQAYTRVQDVLGQVGDVNADTLTASFLATQTQDLKVSLVNELQALRSEVVSLRREQQQANARQGLAA